MEEKVSRNNRFFKHYNSVHTRLYSFLLIVVHSHDDAEELLQETASIMWEQFDRFEEGTNFGAWAVSIARNKALEFLRNNKKTRAVFAEGFYELAARYAQETSEDVTDRTQALQRCLEKLGERDRDLLFMRYRKDISPKRISQLTGRSLNGLYQSFTRIIGLLRRCVERQSATGGV